METPAGEHSDEGVCRLNDNNIRSDAFLLIQKPPHHKSVTPDGSRGKASHPITAKTPHIDTHISSRSPHSHPSFRPSFLHPDKYRHPYPYPKCLPVMKRTRFTHACVCTKHALCPALRSHKNSNYVKLPTQLQCDETSVPQQRMEKAQPNMKFERLLARFSAKPCPNPLLSAHFWEF